MTEIKQCCRPLEPALEEQLHAVLPAQFRSEWRTSQEHDMMIAAATVINRHGLETEWLTEYKKIRNIP